MLGSSNPVLTQDRMDHVAHDLADGSQQQVMTVAGTVNKAAMALMLCIVTAVFVWWQYYSGSQTAILWMAGGGIASFIIAIVTVFVPKLAPYTTLPYAAAAGLFLGGISATFEQSLVDQIGPQGKGLTIQAVACTLGVFAVMLTLYMTRIIQVTNKLRTGIVAAAGGVMIFYMVALVGSLLGWTGASQFLDPQNASLLSIGISVVIVIIASVSLLLDFDRIERGVQMRAPKRMEWYAAFGLMVTLVWLYLEILRLLSKLKSR